LLDRTWYTASWTFLLRPVEMHDLWLIVHWRRQTDSQHVALDPLVLFAVCVVDALMHSRQLRGIKQRAEVNS
jgi:hypothetical protein